MSGEHEPVRAAAERRLDRGLRDVAGLPVVLRHDAVAADGEGQDGVQVAVRPAHEADLALAEGEPAVDVRKHRAQGHGAVLLEHVEGVDHVLDGDRLAVVPEGVVAQLEGDPGHIVRLGDTFGETSVGAHWFVVRAFEEPVVDQARAQAEAGSQPALLQDHVVVVVGAHLRQAEHAGLGRVGVRVRVVCEAGIVLQRQEVGDAVAVFDIGAGRVVR